MRTHTRGLVQPFENVGRRPGVRGRHPSICRALEERSEEIAMFFAFGAPVRGRLVQDFVVSQALVRHVNGESTMG